MGDLLFLTFVLGVLIAYGFCCYRVAQRLGYDGLLGVLLLVPILNFVMMFIWAVSESPNERKLATLQRRLDKAQRQANERDASEPPPEAPPEADALARLGA